MNNFNKNNYYKRYRKREKSEVKKKTVLAAITLSMAVFIGCGSASNVPESSETVAESSILTMESKLDLTETPEKTETPEATEESHEHAYVETITIDATCEADGEATYTCECGDSYTETITATGHVFENYTSNNDATYLADGTETAKCETCDATDTRIVEGSMLTYTYTDMDATMYAQKTVNVRSMPSTEGEKLGSLSTNDEVKVTGQCNETSWYRIEYNGNTAYVSNKNVGSDKVVVEQPKAEATQSTSKVNTNFNSYAEARAYAISLGYPIGQAVDNGNGTAYCYVIGRPHTVLYGEDDALHSADIDSARECAEAIFGWKINYLYHDENGGKHVEKFGNDWTVYRFTYTPRYDLGTEW